MSFFGPLWERGSYSRSTERSDWRMTTELLILNFQLAPPAAGPYTCLGSGPFFLSFGELELVLKSPEGRTSSG